jgi:glycosyltransferase involved in cell wall biosynthesis
MCNEHDALLMRLLFLTGSRASYMAPPQLADEQIIAGPDWPDAKTPEGKWRSLQTPVGEYDIVSVLARIPADQRPDAVVSLVDASWRNLPRGLANFNGPKALLVADTHHLNSPLIGMLKYAASEPYDRVVFLYDRHHLAFFHAAGFRNLFWFPALTLPHDDATVLAARVKHRERRLAFVGQVGDNHPHRVRLLAALKAQDVPLYHPRLSQSQAMSAYGSSLIGFNASLNGDLNLRVFEILASGAALLTDRLAPESGLLELFDHGRELMTYSSAEELAERAAYALANPEETAAMGAAGAAWFDKHFNAIRRRAAFQALLLDGTAVPEFVAASQTDSRVYFSGDTTRLLQTMMVYEGVQELHRTEEKVRVVITPSSDEVLADICSTLPRIEVVRGEVSEPADIAIFNRDDEIVPGSIHAPRVWCCDALPEERSILNDYFAPAGFTPVSEDVAVLCRIAPAAAAVNANGTTESANPRESSRTRVMIFTDDPDSGGVAQYNHSLMVGLTVAGCDVSCAQTRSDNPMVSAQRELGIAHHWIPYDTKKEFVRTFEDQATARHIFEAAKPDLIVFSDCCPVSNMAARDAALQMGIPYVVVVGFVGSYLADRFKQVLGRLALHYARARAVVAVSKENLDLLHNRFGLPAQTGQVIHYGRPEKFFAPADDAVRARLRAELNLPTDAVVCFTAARLAAVKGYLYQILAAKHLIALPGNDHIHFVWAGEGEQRGAIEEAIATYGLTGRVHLLGHRWDVADWYDAADIFVLPSDLEGMPLAIMEAMAKGLPVAATAVSGIPEELGDTGQLLPPGQKNRSALINQLIRTLNLWANDVALRRIVGEAGRIRAEEMFRESLMIERTVSLIGQHIAEPAAAISA